MFLFPRIFLPADYNLPPTLYSIMDSMVNFGQTDKVKIKDLPQASREEIFDFNYPLTNKISKQDFEVLILKHFMMRRIGYDTMTAFKIALDVKLNEIMPIYNKMFDMLDGWDLFSDGEVETRNVTDSRSTQNLSSLNQTNSGTDTSDRRFSELPQNRLSDLQNGNYVTDYNLDTNTTNNSMNNQSSSNITDSGSLNERIERSPADKIAIYKNFLESRESIYTMIFRDLDNLFYGLV